jgi:outer membrane lipoprotein SlyB
MNKETLMLETSSRLLAITSTVALAAGLTACAAYDPYGPNNYPVSQTPPATYPGTYPAQQVGVEYGRVTNVALLRPATGATTGTNPAGTVLGAVVGGALGNQIGSGSGRAAATILGAVGGAVVGNRITGGGQPTYNTAGPVYRISVQTDQGHMRTYDVSATGDLRPGDRVRIENGVIYLA